LKGGVDAQGTDYYPFAKIRHSNKSGASKRGRLKIADKRNPKYDTDDTQGKGIYIDQKATKDEHS
jgi:hypothetical protein